MTFVAHDSFEVPARMGRIVHYVGALRLVDLASVNELFQRASADQSVAIDVADLANAERPVEGLQIMTDGGRLVSANVSADGLAHLGFQLGCVRYQQERC